MDFTTPIIKKCLHLGLCCKNIELANIGIISSRTITRKNFTVKKAQDIAISNLEALKIIIKYNYITGIKCFRIGCDIFPHFNDPQTEKYTIDFALSLLNELGEIIKKYNIRVLMHPCQFNQIGTPNIKVYNNTVNELQHYASILDAMNIGTDGVLIIHGGGIYNSKKNTIIRWIKQFNILPLSVKNRLAIENCEKCYSIDDCLYIAKQCNIPVVLDFFHYYCWKDIQKPIEYYIPLVYSTWSNNGIPIMHISEQKPFSRIGAHSDYVETIPNELLQFILSNNVEIHLEIEAKAKEKAVFHLYKKYNGTPKLKINFV
jgi:UV DNA damage endonuclease